MATQALIIVDFQNDYFPGGKWLLEGIQSAADNAVRALEHARATGQAVIHVRHEFADEQAPFLAAGSEGARVYPGLAEQGDEPVIVKQQVNAFKDTRLEALLDELGIEQLLVVGNMSHVCVDAIVRAGADLGYKITVLHDACATHDQMFNGAKISAAEVQGAFMAGLAFGYAEVVSTDNYLATYR
ncbi:cysteine hydrolase family protein [Pseudomonas entomophila]|uniref:cysteine hydrolase family protein n=1 Tax=Pseudomonas entomophila TaxID=312306 RepID=UPI0023D8C5A5|nr:cysteine hydrolase family protein [Pseudomonas entomophila]MDF0731385.1 cysteine hydrolase family protein [Pseudomonas entomophila]